MTSKELMVGDFMLYNDDICIVDEIRVDNTAVLTALNTDVTSIDGDQVSVDEIMPIPLTAEILEKNGFWCKHNVGYVMEEGEYEIIYDLWDHKLRVLKNREQILNLEYLDEMCIHELQHVLRLCGIDKEIEL